MRSLGVTVVVGFVLGAWLGLSTESPRPGTERRSVIVLLEEWQGAGSLGLSPDEVPIQDQLLTLYQGWAQLTQDRFLARTASILDAGPPADRFWLVNGIRIDATPEQIAELEGRPGVVAVVEDEEVPLVQPLFHPSAPAPGVPPEVDGDGYTYGLKMIRYPEFRQKYPHIDGKGVVVGQIDTGIHGSHVEFAGKEIVFRSFVDRTTRPNDENGHGTHISGTIFGGNVTDTAIGVAPGVSRVFVAKVFGSRGGASVSSLLKAMEWMVDPDGDGSSKDAPRLVSNSWGGSGGRPIFREAVQKWVKLGIFPVFAAGNSGPRAGTVGVPGGYPESLAVGATDSKDEVAYFSSRGPVRYDGKELVKPDVCAPGVNTLSAWVPAPGAGTDDPEYNTSYRVISGTSMATPHVAGVLALLFQARPTLTVDQARTLLEQSADPIGGATAKNNDSGWGRVNLVRLFEKLEQHEGLERR